MRKMFTLFLVARLHRLDAALAASYFESLAVRQWLVVLNPVLNRKTPRPRLRQLDRWFWVLLSKSWPAWRDALVIVKPATVIARQRQGISRSLDLQVAPAPRSPWQSAYVERVIGSLRCILACSLDYDHGCRCHVSLDKDAPDGRPGQAANSGHVVAFPQVGGPHHRYERLAASINSTRVGRRPDRVRRRRLMFGSGVEAGVLTRRRRARRISR